MDDMLEKMEELNDLHDKFGDALTDSEMSGDRTEVNLLQTAIDVLTKIIFK